MNRNDYDGDDSNDIDDGNSASWAAEEESFDEGFSVLTDGARAVGTWYDRRQCSTEDEGQ